MARTISIATVSSIAILFHDTYRGIKFLVSPNTTLLVSPIHSSPTDTLLVSSRQRQRQRWPQELNSEWNILIDIKQPALHRFVLFYNLQLIHMQVCETFLSKKWQTVIWHRECEQSINVHQSRGLDLGGKSWLTQRLLCHDQDQDLHEVSSRILEIKV